MKNYCPNIKTCNLVNSEGFIIDTIKRDFYINEFCKSESNYWKNCNRYISKNELNFCPDFVLPDSNLTPDEIIDKFDNNN